MSRLRPDQGHPAIMALPRSQTLTQHRRQTPPGIPSQTHTETSEPTQRTQPSVPVRTLRIRATAAAENRTIQWADDVVDNEGLGRKRSKGKMPPSNSAQPRIRASTTRTLQAIHVQRANQDRRAMINNDCRSSLLHISCTPPSRRIFFRVILRLFLIGYRLRFRIPSQ